MQQQQILMLGFVETCISTCGHKGVCVCVCERERGGGGGGVEVQEQDNFKLSSSKIAAIERDATR